MSLVLIFSLVLFLCLPPRYINYSKLKKLIKPLKAYKEKLIAQGKLLPEGVLGLEAAKEGHESDEGDEEAHPEYMKTIRRLDTHQLENDLQPSILVPGESEPIAMDAMRNPKLGDEYAQKSSRMPAQVGEPIMFELKHLVFANRVISSGPLLPAWKILSKADPLPSFDQFLPDVALSLHSLFVVFFLNLHFFFTFVSPLQTFLEFRC
jgi:hypothetical protein